MKVKIINIVKNNFGIDKAIFWLLINKFFSLIRSPINAFFMIQYLTLPQQGLWYTFISLGALSVFAELGFTTVVSQFVSYEFAHLKEDKNRIIGDSDRLDRFWGLIKFALKIYLIIIPFAIAILGIVGTLFFKSESVFTLTAWYAYCIIGGISLFVSLFQSIFQGIDKVAIIQKNSTYLSFLLLGFTCLFLFFGMNIWALVVANLFSALFTSFLLFKEGRNFWDQLWKYKIQNRYEFWKEIVPLQWRYAITWTSGFFVFSLTTPAIYKFTNPEVAGKYGLTLAIISSINAISYGWISTKIPKFNMFASRNEENQLIKLFNKSFFQGSLIYIIGIISFFLFLSILQEFSIYGNRFLDLSNTLFLAISNFALFIITSLAVYTRSHRIEPFIFYSSLQALSMIVLAVFLLPIIGFQKFLICNAIFLWLIMVPYMIIMFIKYRLKFENEQFSRV